ncbi:MAG: M3 family oligoendopeptidase [Alicyclobacillaceae bacterium]|jgi:pepF/M3 family oligoendopeptidase|nr:M3 family oligoendopeptidase [Alicyclobacillaceae bacterium]
MSTDMTWDLDVIFKGGSASAEFTTFLTVLDEDVAAFHQHIREQAKAFQLDGFVTATHQFQDIASRIREAGAFISCLTAQNVHDTAARQLQGHLNQSRAAFQAALTQYDAILLHLSDQEMADVLNHPGIAEVAFAITERRQRAADKLPAEQEALVASLSVDGYNGWGELYDTIVGRMHMEVEKDGKVDRLSMGQASNRLRSASQADRAALFAKWEETWAKEADLCQPAINHLAGFRLALYKERQWDSVLREPLEINRMRHETLETMWKVIEEHKEPFVRVLKAKAKRLGVPRLNWPDVDAPLGNSEKSFTFAEAREFIVHHFRSFSPQMADFADQCFERRWIEAEDRPGKRPGGFCTSFPVSAQTRIFMTFSGTASNVATLAHELGHAYHQHVMRGLPQLLTNYAMNVAETASTFAEMIVSDASVQSANSPQERLNLLEDKVGRSISMLMNIHARFLFETRFYEERKRGIVSTERLNELMVAAQREAYGDALGSYHPHFWTSKLHFYITGTPFYNFPYTFGYLFSTGIYALAQAGGDSFADRYVGLLRDTGQMRVEDLAAKHLGADLTQPDFWNRAVQLAVNDAEEFVRLAE